jgi:heme exporter protein C
MIRLLAPHKYLKYSKKLLPYLAVLCFIMFIIGLYYGLIASPADYLQGENVRIMYVHVPAAWMSLGIFLFIASCSLSSIVWKTKLSYILALSAAPIGACFALITLVTGSLWGKPTWGTYWVWDARLTSMFILFLLYISYISVIYASEDIMRAERPAAAIALLGAINIPIVKFSVDLWNSLHQAACVFKMSGPSVDPSMLKPLFIMFLSYILYFIVILILRSHIIISKLKLNNKVS